MTQPTPWPTPADGAGVLITLDRADTALYAPLREWMMSKDLAGQALKAGDDAPNFFLPDDQARLVALRGLLDEGPVVLSFLGGSWAHLKVCAVNHAIGYKERT